MFKNCLILFGVSVLIAYPLALIFGTWSWLIAAVLGFFWGLFQDRITKWFENDEEV